MPFWQFFRMGWDGHALLGRPSKISHRNWKIIFVFGADEYLEEWKAKLESAYSFMLEYSEITVWFVSYIIFLHFMINTHLPLRKSKKFDWFLFFYFFLFQEHDIELSLITLNWFLTLYSSVLHVRLIMRIWDLFLFDGSKILFQVAIGLLKMYEDELLSADNSAEIFNTLSTIPAR